MGHISMVLCVVMFADRRLVTYRRPVERRPAECVRGFRMNSELNEVMLYLRRLKVHQLSAFARGVADT